jgi:hypothetical protein
MPEEQSDQNIASSSSLPPSARRAATIQVLAKRARENGDMKRVGRRKRAQITSKPSQQNNDSEDMDIAMGDGFDDPVRLYVQWT